MKLNISSISGMRVKFEKSTLQESWNTLYTNRYTNTLTFTLCKKTKEKYNQLLGSHL